MQFYKRYNCQNKIQSLWSVADLLSLSQTQKANPETFELQQDVVNSRVSVTGQQHTKPTRVQNPDLQNKKRLWCWSHKKQIIESFV